METQPGPFKREGCQIVDANGDSVALLTCTPEHEGSTSPLLLAAPGLLQACEEAWRVLCWAAQEAQGKVKKEIVGGWLDHAARINAAIAKAKVAT